MVVELLDGAGEAFGPISYSHHYSVAHPLPPHGYAHGRFSLPEHASLPLYVLIQKCLCVSLSSPSYNVCVCMCPPTQNMNLRILISGVATFVPGGGLDTIFFSSGRIELYRQHRPVFASFPQGYASSYFA